MTYRKTSPSNAAATDDLLRGVWQWRIWARLSWKDIKMRYARSLIGPFWLAITTAVWALGLGFVWANLWGIELEGFMPYLTAGVVTWSFLSQMLVTSSTLFWTSKNIINTINLPLSIQVFRFVSGNLISYFHSLPVYIVIAFVFGVDLSLNTLLFFPGLLLLILNITWMSFFFGTIGARFRDLQQILANVLQLLFFVTPIFWHKEFLKGHAYIADINPMYHLLEIVRAPMLGEVPAVMSYAVTITMAVAGWVLAFLVFRKFRARIHYWI